MVRGDSIRELAEPVLADVGLQLWDLEVGPDVVRVFVEKDGGVDLEALSVANEALSALLDEHDDLVPAATYHLEVSSPGLERSLRTPEQYRRYLNTTVTVKTGVAVEAARRHRGVLLAVDDDGIDLLADGTATTVRITYDQVERARTVLDWGRSATGGAPSGRRAGAARKAAGSAGEHQPKRNTAAAADAPTQGADGTARDEKDPAR